MILLSAAIDEVQMIQSSTVYICLSHKVKYRKDDMARMIVFLYEYDYEHMNDML